MGSLEPEGQARAETAFTGGLSPTGRSLGALFTQGPGAHTPSRAWTAEADLAFLAREAQDDSKAPDGFAISWHPRRPGSKALSPPREPSGGERPAQRPARHPV